MTDNQLRVVIAEDHAVVREGTRQLLEHTGQIAVVGEAIDGQEAVRLAAELEPDVVLLDVAMPVLNGIEATRRIRALPKPPNVLLLSAYDDRDYVVAAIEAGAGGYLLKTASTEDIVAAIRAVAREEVVLQPALARKIATRVPEVLSQRELEIVRLAARGMGNRQIAASLRLSVRTVEVHFTSIFGKLGVANRTEAIATAARRGWLGDLAAGLP